MVPCAPMSTINRVPEALYSAVSEVMAARDSARTLVDAAWRQVLLGRGDVAGFLEYLDEEERNTLGVDEEVAAKAFSIVLEFRQRQLAGLPARQRETSLTRAFDDLNRKGIVARQNFSCCGNCAPGDIESERADDSRGYVYFHEQDTERLIEDRSTYIGYGAFIDMFIEEAAWKALSAAGRQGAHERATLELINSTVLPTLQHHGITVKWNGSIKQRILLEDVDYFAEV